MAEPILQFFAEKFWENFSRKLAENLEFKDLIVSIYEL